MIVVGWRRWLGFGFFNGGERDKRGRNREIREEIFFLLYILVDNIYYFIE